ncbi:polyprenyl synthetase family protein [Cellulomonas sp. IC4_254]|uniref:polyprenyl synthetase family protein n=1 Tax=Cellulomonas sp. IC4_254 TaxID=2714040 RepID=UPI001421A781|nr:polyprenyl synthetase family protein [Cellulomonas sp. IC4_254]
MRSARTRAEGVGGLVADAPARARTGGRPHASTATTTVPATPVPEDTGLAARVEDAVTVVRLLLVDDAAARRARARELAAEHAALWRAVGEQIGGGRLMRPRLTVAAYLGLGGTDLAAVAPVAAAQEVLHTAMLVHDDVLDHDDTRRGRPNVTGTVRRRLAARGVEGPAADDPVLAAGLLGGDLAIAAAFDLVASAPVPPATALRVVRSLARAVDMTVAGELLDVTGALHGPTSVDALRVAELKTSVYSCCTPLAAGAVLAGADDGVLGVLDRFGTAFGVAFQLLDDELGVFGDPGTTGKSVLSDLREGKRTELLRLAYLRADDAQRAVLDATVGRPDLTEADAARVRDVMEVSGALAEARLVRADAVRTARTTAAEGLPEPLARYLVDLVDATAGVTG